MRYSSEKNQGGVFIKTSLLILIVLSLIGNIVMVGITYSEHRDHIEISKLYDGALAAGYVYNEGFTSSSDETPTEITATLPATEITQEPTTADPLPTTVYEEQPSVSEIVPITQETTVSAVPQTTVSPSQDTTATQATTKETTTAATTEKVQEQGQQGVYYVTDSGTKYHVGSCGYLKSKNPISLSEAKARGFTPCSRCIK